MTRKKNKNKMSHVNQLTVDEFVQNRGQPTVTHRKETDDANEGNSRKRKTQGEQRGPGRKRQRYRAQTSRTYETSLFKDDESNAVHHRGGVSFTTEETQNRSGKDGRNNTDDRRHDLKAASDHQMYKQQQQRKTMSGQKHQHQKTNRGRSNSGGGRCQTRATLRRGGRDNRYKNGKQDAQVKHPRFMSDEFKDQNALLLNGQLVCRHFLWGRCIKGDDCQLKHIQCYNDLIKEVCKFYIQGFCTKGESCPYMHKSFPCKFFHRKGRCSQGADCKFSHEPLNETTSRLLEEVIKREQDRAVAEQSESSEQPVNTDESGVTEANMTPDILAHQLRPNFYNSTEKDAEQESSLCQTEELSDITEAAVPPQASDEAPPHDLPSTNLNHVEPVCYSVEAMLGPQLYKPLTRYLTTPEYQESAPSSVSHTHSGVSSALADRNQVAALGTVRSHISVVKLSSETYKGFPDLTQASCNLKKHDEEMPASVKPAERVSREVKSELLHFTVTEKSAFSKRKHDLQGKTHQLVAITSSVNCKSESVLPCALAEQKKQTFTPEHPVAHHSGQTSNSECKGGAAVEFVTSSTKTSDSGKSQFAKKSQSGPKQQHYFSEATEEASSKTTQCGRLSAECKKTQKRPFCKLSANPVTDSIKPSTDFSKTPLCPQNTSRSSSPTLQPDKHDKDKQVKPATEPNKASAHSFFSLFAAPLPRMQSQLDHSRTASSSEQSNRLSFNTSRSSDSKQKASSLETPLQCLDKQTLHRPTSKLSHSPKIKDDSSESREQQVNEMSSASSLCDDSANPPTAQSHQQPPDLSDSKGSAVATSAHSVLKTLFLRLSPYPQDGEQEHGCISEGDKSSVCVEQKKQKKNKKKKKRKKMLELAPPGIQPAEHQPPLHTPQISSNLRSPAEVIEPQVDSSSIAHNLPFKPATQPMQHHTRLRHKRASEEAKSVNGSVAVKPFKDLFKTLDDLDINF